MVVAVGARYLRSSAVPPSKLATDKVLGLFRPSNSIIRIELGSKKGQQQLRYTLPPPDVRHDMYSP
jgi:hypothetical protein